MALSSDPLEKAWQRYARASSWDSDHVPAGVEVDVTSATAWSIAGATNEKRYHRFERYDLKAVAPPVLAGLPRSSTRSFDRDRAMTLADVRGVVGGICDDAGRHPIASAGGLYATEAYLFPVRVDGLEPETLLHLVRSQLHVERLWHAPALVEQAFPSQSWVQSAGLIVIVTAEVGIYVARYGERGYRFALQEVGATTHELIRWAGMYGLASCIVGGFHDAVLAAALGLTPDAGEQPLACIALGHPQPKGGASLSPS